MRRPAGMRTTLPWTVEMPMMSTSGAASARQMAWASSTPASQSIHSLTALPETPLLVPMALAGCTPAAWQACAQAACVLQGTTDMCGLPVAQTAAALTAALMLGISTRKHWHRAPPDGVSNVGQPQQASHPLV